MTMFDENGKRIEPKPVEKPKKDVPKPKRN